MICQSVRISGSSTTCLVKRVYIFEGFIRARKFTSSSSCPEKKSSTQKIKNPIQQEFNHLSFPGMVVSSLRNAIERIYCVSVRCSSRRLQPIGQSIFSSASAGLHLYWRATKKLLVDCKIAYPMISRVPQNIHEAFSGERISTFRENKSSVLNFNEFSHFIFVRSELHRILFPFSFLVVLPLSYFLIPWFIVNRPADLPIGYLTLSQQEQLHQNRINAIEKATKPIQKLVNLPSIKSLSSFDIWMKLAIDEFNYISLERMSFTHLHLLCSYLNQRTYMPTYALKEHIDELRICSVLIHKENIKLNPDDLENACLSRGILCDNIERKRLVMKLWSLLAENPKVPDSLMLNLGAFLSNMSTQSLEDTCEILNEQRIRNGHPLQNHFISNSNSSQETVNLKKDQKQQTSVKALIWPLNSSIRSKSNISNLPDSSLLKNSALINTLETKNYPIVVENDSIADKIVSYLDWDTRYDTKESVESINARRNQFDESKIAELHKKRLITAEKLILTKREMGRIERLKQIEVQSTALASGNKAETVSSQDSVTDKSISSSAVDEIDKLDFAKDGGKTPSGSGSSGKKPQVNIRLNHKKGQIHQALQQQVRKHSTVILRKESQAHKISQRRTSVGIVSGSSNLCSTFQSQNEKAVKPEEISQKYNSYVFKNSSLTEIKNRYREMFEARDFLRDDLIGDKDFTKIVLDNSTPEQREKQRNHFMNSYILDTNDEDEIKAEKRLENTLGADSSTSGTFDKGEISESDRKIVVKYQQDEMDRIIKEAETKMKFHSHQQRQLSNRTGSAISSDKVNAQISDTTNQSSSAICDQSSLTNVSSEVKQHTVTDEIDRISYESEDQQSIKHSHQSDDPTIKSYSTINNQSVDSEMQSIANIHDKSAHASLSSEYKEYSEDTKQPTSSDSDESQKLDVPEKDETCLILKESDDQQSIKHSYQSNDPTMKSDSTINYHSSAIANIPVKYAQASVISESTEHSEDAKQPTSSDSDESHKLDAPEKAKIEKHFKETEENLHIRQSSDCLHSKKFSVTPQTIVTDMPSSDEEFQTIQVQSSEYSHKPLINDYGQETTKIAQNPRVIDDSNEEINNITPNEHTNAEFSNSSHAVNYLKPTKGSKLFHDINSNFSTAFSKLSKSLRDKYIQKSEDVEKTPQKQTKRKVRRRGFLLFHREQGGQYISFYSLHKEDRERYNRRAEIEL